MRRGIILSTLALISLLALNGTFLMALADKPTIVIIPTDGLLGESFSFYITATSISPDDPTTASGIQVTDPIGGDYWVLMAIAPGGPYITKIWLYDVGDEVQLIWPADPSSIFSVENDPNPNIKVTANGYTITDYTKLFWQNGDGYLPHTSEVGTYEILLGGSGCAWFDLKSFLVVPEGPLGTLSFLLICIGSLVMYKRLRQPQVKL